MHIIIRRECTNISWIFEVVNSFLSFNERFVFHKNKGQCNCYVKATLYSFSFTKKFFRASLYLGKILMRHIIYQWTSKRNRCPSKISLIYFRTLIVLRSSFISFILLIFINIEFEKALQNSLLIDKILIFLLLLIFLCSLFFTLFISLQFITEF